MIEITERISGGERVGFLDSKFGHKSGFLTKAKK